MSNKGKNHSKKWLISRLKTSGSKKRYVSSIDGDYADTRNSRKNKDWENLPSYEAIGTNQKYFNNRRAHGLLRINYGPLVRFLRGRVGDDWHELSREIEARIPTNLLEYKDCVKRFVADLVEKREDGLWGKREQMYLIYFIDGNPFALKEFYVDPETNTLVRLEDAPSQRKTKGMSTDELRQFRENEKRLKLKTKRNENIDVEEVIKHSTKQPSISKKRQDK